jgi:hypothetical protein
MQALLEISHFRSRDVELDAGFPMAPIQHEGWPPSMSPIWKVTVPTWGHSPFQGVTEEEGPQHPSPEDGLR